MHPQFVQNIKKQLGESESQALLEALTSDSPTSIRINPNKDYSKTFPLTEKVAWSSYGYYLEERPIFTLDPLFHAGTYYVQEASSMFVEQAFRQYVDSPVRVLDLCAAPGGKSTLLQSILPENSLLICNEYIRQRAYILNENVQKWGGENTIVTNNSPEDFQHLHSYFDVILVDAPCSGEGMFRKDPNTISEWSPNNVELCVERQKKILSSIWSSLAENGILIYSTCTYNSLEDEGIVDFICDQLGAEILPVSIKNEWNISTENKGYHFYPHKIKGEGFFLSVLRKTAQENHLKIKPAKRKNWKPTQEQIDAKRFVLNHEQYSLSEINGISTLLPNPFVEEIDYLQKYLKILHVGIPLGIWKGKNFIPHIALALSYQLNQKECESAEIDLTTALSYLKTENIFLPQSPKGLILLTYKKTPIGWVKNLGNRCNSLYPNEWRIRMNIAL